MKFIIDAQLPLSLKKWLNEQNIDAIHTDDLPQKHKTSDKEIIRIAGIEDRIIITKDSDFYQYYLIKGVPKRILFLTTGNIVNKELIRLFELNFSIIEQHFYSESKIIELSNDSITVHS